MPRPSRPRVHILRDLTRSPNERYSVVLEERYADSANNTIAPSGVSVGGFFRSRSAAEAHCRHSGFRITQLVIVPHREAPVPGRGEPVVTTSNQTFQVNAHGVPYQTSASLASDSIADILLGRNRTTTPMPAVELPQTPTEQEIDTIINRHCLDEFTFCFLLGGNFRTGFNGDFIAQYCHVGHNRRLFGIWRREANGTLTCVDFKMEDDMMLVARRGGRELMTQFYFALLEARKTALAKTLDGNTEDYQTLFDYILEDDNLIEKMESDLAKKNRKEREFLLKGLEREKQLQLQRQLALHNGPTSDSVDVADRRERIRRVRNNHFHERIT
jgi:hypothetical protein